MKEQLSQQKRSWIKSDLFEALESLVQVLWRFDEAGYEDPVKGFDDATFSIAIGHIYHHINCAYNGVHVQGDPYQMIEPDEDPEFFTKISRFPLEVPGYDFVPEPILKFARSLNLEELYVPRFELWQDSEDESPNEG